MKFRNAVVVGSFFAFISGCAYLPEGHSSRAKPVSTGDLFASDSVASGKAKVTGPASSDTGQRGLQIRKSKRGNMESYVVRGQRYFTLGSSDGYSARGVASWYGPNFHGRTASNGEVYDMYRLTAAHKTLPLPTYAKVTHLTNGRSVIVKINDRGPFSGDRIIDLSFAAALRLGMVNDGTAMVDIQALSPQQLMVLSGPENTLGIDFYTVGEDGQELLPDNQTPIVATVPAPKNDVVSVAAVATIDKPILAQPIQSDVVTDDALPIVESVAAQSTAAPADGVEMPVATSTDADQLLLDAESQILVSNTSNAEDKPLPTALLPVGAEASGQPLAAVPAAVQSVKLPAGTARSGYYIQAGVYADVADAERIAVDVVLAAPGEEVHVKPLKDSHMYRITVGPIVTSEHASKVSGLLTAEGLDNFTVNVK